MKTLIFALMVALLPLTATAERTAAVRFALPPTARYVTTDPSGEVNFWQRKPKIITTDATPGQPPVEFWSDGNASVLQIVGGVKHRNWKKSIRRVR